MEIGQAMRRAKGRVGRKPRVLWDIVKAFRRPHQFARCRFAGVPSMSNRTAGLDFIDVHTLLSG